MHVFKTVDPLPLEQSDQLPDYIWSITEVPSRRFVQIRPRQHDYCPPHPELEPVMLILIFDGTGGKSDIWHFLIDILKITVGL